MEKVLSVQGLSVEFRTEAGVLRAVDKVSFDLAPGETMGIVGESGCGKTVTSLAVLRLIPSPPGKIVEGKILLNGRDLVALPESQLRSIRGKEISMIFQEPMTALNPVFRVGSQLTDVIQRHSGLSRTEAWNKGIEMLKQVRIPLPEKRMQSYPHEMSGGMRQRVMIAMALSCKPSLLIADEPTTALDVTTQAQVLEEMKELQRKFKMALIMVTHDLGVVAETCQKIMVMYCGRVIEAAPVADVFARPRHPYTKALMESIPKIRKEKLKVLPAIKGMVPDLLSLPSGCAFADRCPKVQDKCRVEFPVLSDHGGNGQVACHFPEN